MAIYSPRVSSICSCAAISFSLRHGNVSVDVSKVQKDAFTDAFPDDPRLYRRLPPPEDFVDGLINDFPSSNNIPDALTHNVLCKCIISCLLPPILYG